eukprot:1941056-Prymnesium_polylepis.1
MNDHRARSHLDAGYNCAAPAHDWDELLCAAWHRAARIRPSGDTHRTSIRYARARALCHS